MKWKDFKKWVNEQRFDDDSIVEVMDASSKAVYREIPFDPEQHVEYYNLKGKQKTHVKPWNPNKGKCFVVLGRD